MVCEKGLPMASCPDPAPWAKWGRRKCPGAGGWAWVELWVLSHQPWRGGGGPLLNQGAEEVWEALAL